MANTHQVRSSQSGILYFPKNDSDDSSYANCVTQAAAISLQYPNDQLCVIPVGASVISARPPLTYEELQALAPSVRRQTVLLQA
jgi:hypothetical protein